MCIGEPLQALFFALLSSVDRRLSHHPHAGVILLRETSRAKRREVAIVAPLDARSAAGVMANSASHSEAPSRLRPPALRDCDVLGAAVDREAD